MGNELHLFLSDRKFVASKVTVSSSNLSGWNICDIGTVNKKAPLERLQCTSLCLRSRIDDLGSMASRILQLQIEYSEAMLQKDKAELALRNNRAPQIGASPVRVLPASGVPSLSSSSSTGQSFRGLPSLRSTESLAGMIGRDTVSSAQPQRVPVATELA